MLNKTILIILISLSLIGCDAALLLLKKNDNKTDNATSDNSSGNNGNNNGDNGTSDNDSGNNGNNNGDNGTSDNDSGNSGGGGNGGDIVDDGTGNDQVNPPLNCTYTFNTSPVSSLVAGTFKGLYFSQDNGTTWTKSQMPVGANGRWISLVDLGGDVLLAGSGEDTDGLGIAHNPGHGILKSTDGGKTWSRTGMQKGQWSDLYYVGNGVVLAGSNTSDVGGVWRSTNYGDTWSQNIDNGKPYNYYTADKPANSNGFNFGFIGAFGRVDNCTVIIAYNIPVQNNRYNLFHLSKDGGKTWFRVFEPLDNANLGSQFLLHRSGRISVALDSYSGIGISTFNGILWNGRSTEKYSFGAIAQSKKTETVVAGVHGLDILALGYDRGTDVHGGLWRSTNDGQLHSYSKTNMNKYFWKSILALDNGDFLAGCTSAGNATEFICTGLYKSIDDGLNWNKLNNTLNTLVVYKMIDVRK